jgi:ubiquinone/menaquinone biosynthesis C-methylase UbiE
MLRIAEEKNYDIAWAKQDITELSYPKNYFDVVISRMVFHHFYDSKLLLTALLNVCKILKDEGKFIFIESIPCDDRFLPEWKTLISKEDRNYHSRFDWLRIMESLFYIEKEYVYILKDQSIKNWLDNAKVDSEKKEELWMNHLFMNEEHKKLCNYKSIENDITVDFKHMILVLKKKEVW